MVRNLPASAGDAGLIPGLEGSPGEGNGSPLQKSRLEDPLYRGSWWATIHGTAKSQKQLSKQAGMRYPPLGANFKYLLYYKCS